jgi:hypothetical protein
MFAGEESRRQELAQREQPFVASSLAQSHSHSRKPKPTTARSFLGVCSGDFSINLEMPLTVLPNPSKIAAAAGSQAWEDIHCIKLQALIKSAEAYDFG